MREHDAGPADGESTKTRRRDGRILIVDDQEVNVSALEAILKRAGYSAIASTSDSRKAVELCRSFRPDLMLLDIKMPHLDGFQVMEALQDADKDSLLPILVLTAETERTVRLRALQSGAKDFLAKPFDTVEVLIRIHNMLETRLLQTRLHDYNRRLELEVRRRTGKLENALEILRQAESKLAAALKESEKTSRAKSDFVSNMSHELRTPLNAIMGFSEIIREETLGPVGSPRYREYASDIHDAASHLLGIIDDILDLSKAEAGRLDLRIEDVDVAKAVDGCVRMLSEQAKAAGVELNMDIPEDFPILRTDKRRLRQILLNIASNGIKFTPAGGTVTIKGHHDPADGAMIIVISDTGIGISPEDVAVVLSPYGRVKDDRRRPQEGTGLGLPLTKKLIESLGGTFELRSQVGFGTAVTVTFPSELVKYPDTVEQPDRRVAG